MSLMTTVMSHTKQIHVVCQSISTTEECRTRNSERNEMAGFQVLFLALLVLPVQEKGTMIGTLQVNGYLSLSSLTLVMIGCLALLV